MKHIKSIALLASVSLSVAANAVEWNGANGECAFDDSSKWTGWTSWNSTSTWIVNRSKTAALCTATMSGDLTLGGTLSFRYTGAGVHFDVAPHVLTVPGLEFHNSFTPHTVAVDSGTLALWNGTATNTFSFAKNLSGGKLTFSGNQTVFAGNLLLQEHTNCTMTVSDGAKWYGSLTDSNAGGDRVTITGAGTTVDTVGRSFKVAGSALKNNVSTESYQKYFRNMYCEISDGAVLKNVTGLYVGEYGNTAEFVVSNATVSAAEASMTVGDQISASNNVVRILDGSSVDVASLALGGAGRGSVCVVDGGSHLAFGGDYFRIANKQSAKDCKLIVSGGATVTNRATNTYIGTANVGALVRVTDGGEFYCQNMVSMPYDSGFGSRIDVSDGGRLVAAGTLCVGFDNKEVTVPNELFIGANGTGTVNAVSIRGTGNRVVISNGTLNASSVAPRNSSGCTFAVQGANAKVKTTGDFNFAANAYTLEFALPKEGFADTPIQCGGVFSLKSNASLDLSVEYGINGSYRLIKADGGISAGATVRYLTDLVASWNEELKAQTDYKLKLELREDNTELWLNARTKGGLTVILR